MIKFLQEWDWIGLTALGLWACWTVLAEAYGEEPVGQGRWERDGEDGRPRHFDGP